MEQLISLWTDFQEILYLIIFWKSVENASLIQVWQEWRVLHMKTDIHFFMYVAEFFIEWDVSDKSCGENQNAHYMLSNFFNHTLYEIMWKNNVEVTRPQMTIWHMHIACCLTRVTDIDWICYTYFYSTTAMVAWMHLNVQCYIVHILPIS